MINLDNPKIREAYKMGVEHGFAQGRIVEEEFQKERLANSQKSAEQPDTGKEGK